MRDDIFFEKVWQDDCMAEFKLSYFSYKLKFEDNFYMQQKDFDGIIKLLKKEIAIYSFGDKNSKNCTLWISETPAGRMIINLKINLYSELFLNNELQTLNVKSPFAVEPAVIDRIVAKLKKFYDSKINAKISLLYDYFEEE